MKEILLNIQSFRISKRWRDVLLAVGLFWTLLLCAACGSAETTEPTPAPAADAATAPAQAAADPTVAPAPPAAESGGQNGEKVPPPAELAQGEASKLEPSARNSMYQIAPAMQLDAQKYYYATLKTDRGDIKVQLFADRAPLAVNNFVFLARDGFYNNTTFHRVLEGFMMQGGDPTGTGSGGPGYEFVNEDYPGAAFDRPGLLAMANAGPNTNGSQFFITFAAAEHLNGGYTLFGEVIEGQDVLSQITRRDPQQNPGFVGDTLYTVLIEESDSSQLPTPTPAPPTATPTQTPTPYAPSSLDNSARPLATVAPVERANYFNTAPEMVIDTSKQYTATIKTNKGDLVVQLYDDVAPVAVNNFIVLVNLGFYDGLPINQNSPNNVLVIGSPNNIPAGDVGYSFAPEVNLPITPTLGSIAYLPFQDESGALRASGSQLLVAQLVPPPTSSAQYSFFGKLVSGLEIVAQLTTEDKIEQVTITATP
jgi:cyclophilin family peptidyl-prolyl cis-trans isomerase